MHTAPPTGSREWNRWLASHRPIIETTFAWLAGRFGIKRLNAYSRGGNIPAWLPRQLPTTWGFISIVYSDGQREL